MRSRAVLVSEEAGVDPPDRADQGFGPCINSRPRAFVSPRMKMALFQLALSLCFLILLPQEATAQCDYQVEIKTTCTSNGGLFDFTYAARRAFNGYGTDGKVELNIHDAWSNSADRPTGSLVASGVLDNPGNDFEDCSLDQYTINNQPCINFCSSTLRLSATNSLADIGLAWHPDYVKVSGNGITRTFRIDRWINANTPLNRDGDQEEVYSNQC